MILFDTFAPGGRAELFAMSTVVMLLVVLSGVLLCNMACSIGYALCGPTCALPCSSMCCFDCFAACSVCSFFVFLPAGNNSLLHQNSAKGALGG